MARRRYVSIKEVAARAGVSFQTASKGLNGGGGPAPIGLGASAATDGAIAQASVAAEQAAREHGHSVLVGHLAAGGADGADIVRTLIERRVDGSIAAAPEGEEGNG